MARNVNLPKKQNELYIKNNLSPIEFKKYLFTAKKAEHRRLFSILKYKCSLDTINKVIKDLTKKNTFYNEYIFDNPLPKSYDELGGNNSLKRLNNSFEKEVNWSLITIEKFSAEINKFIELKNLYEINFLNANYEKADNILDTIEKDICVSIWSIENRLLLAEYRYGLEENKRKLNEINTDKINNIVSIIAEFLSRKAERTTSVQKYENFFDKFLQRLRKSNPNLKSLPNFLEFKLNFYFYKEQKDYTDVICCENSFSVIDRYLTLTKVFQLICCYDFSAQKKAEVKKYVCTLIQKINDKNLTNILYYLNPSMELETNELSDKMIDISDLYTYGHYLQCFELTKKQILLNPNCFELYEFYIKSLLYIKSDFEEPIEGDSILNCVLRSMFIIYTKDEKANENVWNMVKIVQNIGNTNFCNQLILSIDDNLIKNRTYSNTFRELNSKFMNPRLAKAYKTCEDSFIYLTSMENKYKDSITIKFWKQYYSILIEYTEDKDERFRNLKIDQIRIERYLAEIFEYYKEYDKSIYLNKSLIEKSKTVNKNYRIYIYEKIIVNLFNSYLKLKDVNECISLVVNNFLDKEYLIKRFNVNELVMLIENLNNEEIYKDISVPIIYYLNNPKEYSRIYSAYDNFIYINNVEKASDLIRFENKFDKRKLIYFLKNVCVSENIDGSPYLEGTDDLEQERICICQWLTNLDHQNKKMYDDEISKITQKSIIRNRIQQIDDSKIYVDIEGIKNSSYNVMKDSFDRYIKLASIMKSLKILNLNNLNVKTDALEPTELYILDTNFSQKPRYVLFNEIFLELRDKFISRYEYGLDYYLGMRIRHGTLLSQLRKHFDANNLITNKKDKQSDEYPINIYWQKKFHYLNEDLRNKLQVILKDFSRSIDDIIIKVPNKWIQVKTETNNSEGLFDFKIYESTMMDFYIICEKIDNYDEFIDVVFDILWQLTEANLKIVRDKISNDLKKKFIDCIDDLENKISGLLDSNDTSVKELKRSIAKCRTNMQNEMDNIARWFNLAKNKNNVNFNMIQLFEVSIEIIKNIYPKYKMYSWDADISEGSIFIGQVFTYFVDIILILLNNVVVRSDLDPNALQLEIKTIENEEFLDIVIKNSVSEEKQKSLENNIKGIKDKIENINSIKELASNEGGSGYPKIVKTLKFDLKINHSIEVNNIENKYFQVKIRLEKKGLIANENSNC